MHLKKLLMMKINIVILFVMPVYKQIICVRGASLKQYTPNREIITDDSYGWQYHEDFNKEGKF